MNNAMPTAVSHQGNRLVWIATGLLLAQTLLAPLVLAKQSPLREWQQFMLLGMLDLCAMVVGLLAIVKRRRVEPRWRLRLGIFIIVWSGLGALAFLGNAYLVYFMLD